MGTEVQRLGLGEGDYRGKLFPKTAVDLKGNNDVLSLTQPQCVRKIHEAYLAAGSDIIETNTFNANAISQADYQLEAKVYEMNVASARLAKEAASIFSAKNTGWPHFVAGSVGPTNKTASISPDVNDPAFRAVSFDQLVTVYTQQMRGLLDGGADIILLETIFDTLNAKAAIFAFETICEQRGERLPLMISGTITDKSGRTLSGQTPEAFWISVAHARPLCVGFNCALGAAEMRPSLVELARVG